MLIQALQGATEGNLDEDEQARCLPEVLIAMAVLFTSSTPSGAYFYHHGGHPGGAIAAGIVGLAVGAAVAGSVRRDAHVYGSPVDNMVFEASRETTE